MVMVVMKHAIFGASCGDVQGLHWAQIPQINDINGSPLEKAWVYSWGFDFLGLAPNIKG